MADTDALERRIMELEIRSEERRDEIARLESFIHGYENRVASLEGRVNALAERAKNPAEPLPAPEDERPPHY
jgi:uncharacterized coiled-coil protein SlyX